MAWKRCGDTGFYRTGPDNMRTYLDPLVMIRIRSMHPPNGVSVMYEALTNVDPGPMIAAIPPEMVDVVGRWAARVNDAREDVRPGWWRPILDDLDVDQAARDQLLDVLDNFLTSIPRMVTRKTYHVSHEGFEKDLKKYGIPAC